MPAPPNLHAVAAILLAFLAVYLFTREKIPLESSGLFVLLVIVAWVEVWHVEFDGVRLTVQDVFAQFGNEALITICGLMILSKGVERTGALQPVGHVLARLWKVSPRFAFLVTMLIAAILSMFLNNTPVVMTLMTLLVAVSLQAGISPSGILMPIGFATIVGGMATTIGTSTNLLVTGVAADLGVREFGMFDFALPVFVVGGVAIFFLWSIAPRLLPDRQPPLTDTEPRIFESKLQIEPRGFADGKRITEVLARCKGLRIRRLVRGETTLMKLPNTVIRAGDRLHVRDTPKNLKEFEHRLGATLLASDTSQRIRIAEALSSDEHVAEIVVTARSILDNSTLDRTRLLPTYGLVPLAVHRSGRVAKDGDDDPGGVMLQVGDVILVQGSARGLERLHRSNHALVLDNKIRLPHTARAPLSLLIVAGVVILAAFGIVRISIAALVGLTIMILTHCINWRDAIAALDRQIVVIIVASLALGLLLMSTGAAEYVATLYVALTGRLPVAIVLAGFMLIMALLTEVVTNNAIAVLGTPIAISVAAQLGVPPEPFVIGLLYGANMSYIMPVGYQTNLLVMSAGGYRFSDFARVGVPLQLIMWLGLSIGLYVVYDL